MSTTKHTPGPWTIAVDADGLMISIESGDPVAEIRANFMPGDNNANAHLIAAAPNLLAACKQMVKSLNGSPGDFDGMLAAHRALDAAIAKATGNDDGGRAA